MEIIDQMTVRAAGFPDPAQAVVVLLVAHTHAKIVGFLMAGSFGQATSCRKSALGPTITPCAPEAVHRETVR
jgi:hypothetical protein